ncbi:hypothetical protein PUN28_006375 [Cardiocondyla obscurior]|uniref:Uncharacterized protein n=1 Tax=Cardiocondyla obscurior TaxID=286306 RepID=A0AAW2GDN3_9HYME
MVAFESVAEPVIRQNISLFKIGTPINIFIFNTILNLIIFIINTILNLIINNLHININIFTLTASIVQVLTFIINFRT